LIIKKKLKILNHIQVNQKWNQQRWVLAPICTKKHWTLNIVDTEKRIGFCYNPLSPKPLPIDPVSFFFLKKNKEIKIHDSLFKKKTFASIFEGLSAPLSSVFFNFI